ncbi:hypothetical protein [Pontibacter rugosus]|uniref:DUF4231 domain-containing protein n=1 Tax=Pontibacter rugosus TaxID=1745966 RepID=A0ABW3SVP4_9BACT
MPYSTATQVPALETLLDLRSEIRTKVLSATYDFYLPEATEQALLQHKIAVNSKWHRLLYLLSFAAAILFIVASFGIALYANSSFWLLSILLGLVTFSLTLQTLLLRQKIEQQQNKLFLLQLDEQLAQVERLAMFRQALG